MTMRDHDDHIHAALIDGNGVSLLAIHDIDSPDVRMMDVANRIRTRLEELKMSQAEAAVASGVSPQRFGNYVQGKRTPDVIILVRIARALRTTTDWLLGVSDSVPVDVFSVVLRLLELEGMSRERAEVIASTAEEALRLLAALPAEGDSRSRSLLAAQAAWQIRPNARPS